ncbi:MAG: hypothetical protein D6797_00275 [Bdellovibrio sp.]|nr:MAG: hypothetical protein D6797_00275 [Bdellovibrio sp.]
MRFFFFFLFLSWGHLCFSGPHALVLKNQSVGKLKGHVVTLREVQINYAVEQALYSKPQKKSKIQIIQITDPRFSKEVTAVLMEWAIFLEAKNFRDSWEEASDKEIVKAMNFVLPRLLSTKGWKKLGVRTFELKQTLKRKLIAKAFIRFKLKASMVPITEDEAQKYYEENKNKFGGAPYERFADSIKEFLKKQQRDQRLKDWFEVLQTKYKVENFMLTP